MKLAASTTWLAWAAMAARFTDWWAETSTPSSRGSCAGADAVGHGRGPGRRFQPAPEEFVVEGVVKRGPADGGLDQVASGGQHGGGGDLMDPDVVAVSVDADGVVAREGAGAFVEQDPPQP